MFADRLWSAVRSRQSPLMVGLDPRWEQLPEALTGGVAGGNAGQMADAYGLFCREVIDAVADVVGVVKPQSAFFEHLGPPGAVALAATIQYARDRGLLVVLDGKRNDIGSTAEAYAAAYLGADSAWGADALTVNPYLGEDSLEPFVDAARGHDAGIFVLVKTSNPGGGRFQDLSAEGRPVYRHVAECVQRLAAGETGQCGFGSVGAVVGATYPEQLAELRAAMPHAWLLVPGFGAQGGSAADVAAAFDERGAGAIVNSSRGVIFAYRRAEYAERFGSLRWQEAVAEAAREASERLRSETPAGRLES